MNHKVWTLDVNDGIKKLEDNSIDLLIADPPYFQINEKWDKFKNIDDFISFNESWISKIDKKLKNGSSIYVFNSSKNIFYIWNILLKNGYEFQNLISWYKKDAFSYSKYKYVSNKEEILFFTKGKKPKTFNFDEIRVPYESTERINHAKKKGILKNGKRWYPNTNGKLSTDVWEFTSNHNVNKEAGKNIKNIHPTQKPFDLIEKMILASSKRGDNVLDLFSGSGTTSLASKKHFRNSFAIESDKAFTKIIRKRLRGEDV